MKEKKNITLKTIVRICMRLFLRDIELCTILVNANIFPVIVQQPIYGGRSGYPRVLWPCSLAVHTHIQHSHLAVDILVILLPGKPRISPFVTQTLRCRLLC